MLEAALDEDELKRKAEPMTARTMDGKTLPDFSTAGDENLDVLRTY